MFPRCVIQMTSIVIFTLCAKPTVGRGIFNERKRKSSLRSSTSDAEELQFELSNAMGEALGCGGHLGEQQLAAIEKVLTPIYSTLPKNDHGYIERRSLRFLAYRYFIKKYALLIRGFEPSRPTNSSNWGSTDILSQRVPAYVESVLQSKHAQERGFHLTDAVQMVATLEQLIFDSESSLLEVVYAKQHKPPDRSLSHQGVEQLLETYLIHWMLDDDEIIDQLSKNRTFLEEAFPQWNKIVDFTRGQIKTMQYQRENMPQSATRFGHNALSLRYSFEDVHSLVGGITKSFASFWESECSSLKAALVKMDTHRTGRVPLSKFYNSALDSDWRFGESESYLRELGALDETSWHGKQVIIPNYIQAASNCIVTTPHYLVCCINDCEAHLNEIEISIGGPTAPPAQILALVSNMTATITLDDDESPHIQGTLTKHLEQIAATHGGQVPISGRLFAQWLHYVFPRECAYPYKSGEITALTPSEFGNDHIATEYEMQKLVDAASDVPVTLNKEDLQWMSQWSDEEELVLNEPAGMPWRYKCFLVMAGILVIFGASYMGGITLAHQNVPGSVTKSVLPMHRKAHFV